MLDLGWVRTSGRIRRLLSDRLPQVQSREVTVAPNAFSSSAGANGSVRVCTRNADFGDPRNAPPPKHPQNLSAHGQKEPRDRAEELVENKAQVMERESPTWILRLARSGCASGELQTEFEEQEEAQKEQPS